MKTAEVILRIHRGQLNLIHVDNIQETSNQTAPEKQSYHQRSSTLTQDTKNTSTAGIELLKYGWLRVFTDFCNTYS
jgi:hypothetical protein